MCECPTCASVSLVIHTSVLFWWMQGMSDGDQEARRVLSSGSHLVFSSFLSFLSFTLPISGLHSSLHFQFLSFCLNQPNLTILIFISLSDNTHLSFSVKSLSIFLIIPRTLFWLSVLSLYYGAYSFQMLLYCNGYCRYLGSSDFLLSGVMGRVYEQSLSY